MRRGSVIGNSFAQSRCNTSRLASVDLDNGSIELINFSDNWISSGDNTSDDKTAAERDAFFFSVLASSSLARGRTMGRTTTCTSARTNCPNPTLVSTAYSHFLRPFFRRKSSAIAPILPPWPEMHTGGPRQVRASGATAGKSVRDHFGKAAITAR